MLPPGFGRPVVEIDWRGEDGRTVRPPAGDWEQCLRDRFKKDWDSTITVDVVLQADGRWRVQRAEMEDSASPVAIDSTVIRTVTPDVILALEACGLSVVVPS